MIIYFIKSNVKRIGNSKILNFIICASVVGISFKVFKNNTAFNIYSYKIYPYFLIGVLSIFLVITIGVFIKKRIKKNNTAYSNNK